MEAVFLCKTIENNKVSGNESLNWNIVITGGGIIEVLLCVIIIIITKYTRTEQNVRLDVTSLESVTTYCKEDNKIKPNM